MKLNIKKLSWPAVVMVVKQEFGLDAHVDPYGVEIGSRWEGGFMVRYRLECGSGIAGLMGIWWLVPISVDRWNHEHPNKIETPTQLRKALREWRAGEKPAERKGYTLYAKVVHLKGGDSYVWNYRKAR